MYETRHRTSLSEYEHDRTPSFSAENRAPGPSSPTPALSVVVGCLMGSAFRLQGSATTLGRNEDASIVIPDEGVSRKHAVVRRRGPLVSLADAGSKNGTFVNERRVTSPMILSPGDCVRLGPYATLRFGFHDELDEQVQTALYQRATRDPLTSSLNRRAFDERMVAEWGWAVRQKRPLAIVAFDVDYFKAINDRHGHAAGDYVLAELSRIVSVALRSEDVFARTGGEEFAVMARATARESAVTLAERIRTLVERHSFTHAGVRLPVTVSVGVATSADAGVDAIASLMARADAAIYVAKAAGRNRVATLP